MFSFFPGRNPGVPCSTTKAEIPFLPRSRSVTAKTTQISPTEPRGISGYTFAVGCESDFDQSIRLQRDEIEDRDFRQPFPPYLEDEEPSFGVFVYRVALDGNEVRSSPFLGAPVRWRLDYTR